MKIIDYVSEESIIFIDDKLNKKDLLKLFAKKFKELGLVSDEIEVFNALMDREKLSSTGMGEKVAIPHAKINDLDDIKLLIGISKVDQDFDAMDGLPVRVFFVVIAPSNQMQKHLKILARIARLVKLTEFKEKALQSENPKEIIKVLEEEESKL